MKRTLWNGLVRMTAAMPAELRMALADLLFCAGAARNPPREGLVELLQAYERLEHRLDEAAIRHEGGDHPKHHLTDYHRFFVERIGAGDRVLDVGCGEGVLAASLAGTGARITAVDLKPENIEAAQRRHAHANVHYAVADVTRTVPHGPHDVVVLSNVLEHIENRQAFLRGIAAVAAPKRWLIRVPAINRDWRVPLRRELGLPSFCDPEHFIEYTPETLKGELEFAGLVVTEEQVAWGEIWVSAVACKRR